MFNAKYLHINFMFTSAFERFQCFKRRILAGWVGSDKKAGVSWQEWGHPAELSISSWCMASYVPPRRRFMWYRSMAVCHGAVCVGEAEQHILARPGNGCEHQGKPERRNQARSGGKDCIIRSASILHLNSAALLIGCEQEFCWQIKLWCRKCCADASAVKPWTQLRKHLCTISLVCNAYQPLAALGRCEKPGKRALTKQAGRGGVSQARTMSWGNPPCHIPSVSPPSCKKATYIPSHTKTLLP